VREIEIILGLLLAVTLLVMLARRLAIPYPILLVLGGLALSFVPGLPRIEFEPGVIFLLFLPPIILSAAYVTPIRDFRANIRSITLLAVGLPIFTMCVVAVVAHGLIDGMTWPVAFVLGAIVSPPDAVATTSVAQNMRLPRQLLTVLEGESLVNDATALVAYKLAIAAVATGAFSVWEAGFGFLVTGAGGLLVGLVVGVAAVWIMRRIEDPPVVIMLQILSSYASYLLADSLGVSGVLAAVATGFYFGRAGSTAMSSGTRLEATSVWQIMIFVLNGLVFILIGLMLPALEGSLSKYGFGTLLAYGGAISLAVVLARIVWVPLGAYLPRLIINSLAGKIRDPYPSWQAAVVATWAGMRGIVSLAAALAIPVLLANGQPFPDRELIIFLTFVVILVTLVVQGLTLTPLIRLLKLEGDGKEEVEENKARLVAAKAGASRLDELAGEEWVLQEMVDDMRAHYAERRRRYSSRYLGSTDDGVEAQASSYLRMQRELLTAERQAVIKLRNSGVINDEVLRRVERDLDLEEQSLRG
jgi:Na+/H+ antiporter